MIKDGLFIPEDETLVLAAEAQIILCCVTCLLFRQLIASCFTLCYIYRVTLC